MTALIRIGGSRYYGGSFWNRVQVIDMIREQSADGSTVTKLARVRGRAFGRWNETVIPITLLKSIEK